MHTTKADSKYNPLKIKGLKVQFNLKRRLEIYELIEMILDSGVSIEDSLRQIISNYKANKQSFLDQNLLIIEILEDVYYRYTHLGLTFVSAFSLYIPKDELMILSSNRDVKKSLAAARKIGKKLQRLKQEIFKSLVKPVIYLGALIGMILFSSFMLLPTIVSSIPKEMLPTFTMTFYHFNLFIGNHLIIFCIFIIILIFVYQYTSSRVCHPIRLAVLDKLPPFSIYKNIQAIKFMITLSTMLSNKNNSIVHAMDHIGHNANTYLMYYIKKISTALHVGYNSGDALVRSNLFNKKVSSLLAIYSSLGKFEFGIHQLADNYLERQITLIKRIFSLVNTLSMALTALYIVCFMWAIYAIGINAV
ncbi:type II secretion system F family protein [Facilibium subflavum]|uniref:type II secretion system F family protein n=1 Tax=Facilibium subflavum TaxID=2219058 RepID=UPI0013C376DC|nr:type II secretion system F family protein [Facilibium subflavum]